MNLQAKYVNSVSWVLHCPHHQHHHDKRVAIEVETDECRKEHQGNDREDE
jgi:hypothetical protein